MAAYIDLSEKHGHRNDHGFACGAEFNVKIRRRINIPDFVHEQLSQGAIDAIWWEEAEQARDSLKEALSRRYKWIGELSFVGRGPGWLAIEDTECKSRNWDTIGKVVDQYLKNFIKSMEGPRFWRDVKGVEKAAAPAVSHATRKKSPAQLDREIKEALTQPATETTRLPPSVRVARAGLESASKYGIKNLRYGLYRHAGDRAYQWGTFTGTPEHVITAVVPNAKNTASQEALVRALKWKR